MADRPYTHIIVGAGSAGCVVTARLAENANFNVLLIEAGPDYEANIPKGMANARRVPMRGQTDVFDTTIDWNVKVNIGHSSMVVPQAKVVGGGSSINGGTALRNSRADSAEWVALGNSAWSFEDVYPIYESMEDDDVRGLRGPHPIRRVNKQDIGKIQASFVKGAIESNLGFILDQNEPGAEGVSPSPVCRRGDQRISSANTYIDPIRRESNLTIRANTLVEMISFDGTQVSGVVLADGTSIEAREVVICAGAIFTPAILQRSAIGPRGFLSILDIQPIIDLPVGLNLSDHPCIPIVAKPHLEAYNQGDYSLQCNARWSSSKHPGVVDLQLVCFSYLYTSKPEPHTKPGRSLAGMVSGHVSGIGCNLNKPTSLGYVAIRSLKATEQPTVTPAYLSTPHDKEVTRELVRKGYQIMQSAPMRSVMGPPMIDIDIDVDEELDSYIQAQVTSTYHFCGSCRMANRDKGGVVDQSGRVYGLQGLTLADASVLPTVPSANTMWTTMMFAERIGRSMRDNQPIV